MTKIRSRPITKTVGSGPYVLKMEFEELQLIAAFLHVTRLGTGSIYREAACSLMTTMDELFGETFTEDSSVDVDLVVSHLEDISDTIIEQFHYTNISMEV